MITPTRLRDATSSSKSEGEAIEEQCLRVLTRAGLLAGLTYLRLPSQAFAHPAHAEHSGGWLSDFLVLSAAGLALLGVTVGGVALWRRQVSAERRSDRLATWAGGLMAIVIVVASAAWYAGSDATEDSPAVAQSYSGTELSGVAPNFQLTDQRGEPLALSDFRGQVVLLAFLDPNCTDICPLTASQFLGVSERLGTAAAEVSFLAVNVNPGANTVEEVAQASEKWRVGELASWHFLTGTAEELEPIWRAYSVQAGNPKAGQPAEVAHSPGVYVIDQQGQRRWYVSVPQDALLDSAWEGPSFGELLLRHIHMLLDE